MPHIRQLPSGHWRVEWHITTAGQLLKGSKTLPTHAAALSLRDELAHLKRSNASTSGVPTVEDVMPAWFTHCLRFTPGTRALYAMVLSRLFIETHIVTIADLNANRIHAYLGWLHDRGRSNRTLNCHLTAVKSFCRWLHRTHGIPNAAANIAMFKEDPPRLRIISPAEYAHLIRATTPPVRDWIRFLANSGLRAAEFCGLTWSAYNPQQHTLTVVGKGRKLRTIPLNHTCVEVLGSLIPPQHTHLFVSKSYPITTRRLRDAISSAAAAINLRIGPHHLRHYFATQLLLAGVPILKVSMLLGHSSIVTTQAHYAHILSPDLLGLTDCLCRPTPTVIPPQSP